MTKSEPLKGDRFVVCGTFLHENKSDLIIEKPEYAILSRRVKSVVEWLKRKCFRELIDGTMESRDNLSTFDMHELIDEAFEDVMKDEKEK